MCDIFKGTPTNSSQDALLTTYIHHVTLPLRTASASRSYTCLGSEAVLDVAHAGPSFLKFAYTWSLCWGAAAMENAGGPGMAHASRDEAARCMNTIQYSAARGCG